MGLLSSRRGIARVASLALAPPPCVRGEVYLTSPHLEPIGAARNSRVDPVPFLILPRFCSTSLLVVDHRSLRVSGAAAAQRGGQISPDPPPPDIPPQVRPLLKVAAGGVYLARSPGVRGVGLLYGAKRTASSALLFGLHPPRFIT